jgi:hypothetical protein
MKLGPVGARVVPLLPFIVLVAAIGVAAYHVRYYW